MRRWVEAGRDCRERLSSDEGGFTLVEVMAAITILVVAVLAIAGVAAQSMRSTRLARDRQLATQAATAALEMARSLSYGDLAMEATCAQAVAEPDYVTGSCPGTPELISTTPNEDLILSSDPDAIDYKVVEGRFTVRSFVSWFDDPSVTGTRDAKRVTTSVTWDEVGGPAREVVQSTIVSEADRGLPVPEFAIRPSSQQQVVETGRAICLNQTLTNIGAADTYDFLAAKGGSSTAQGNRFQMGNWFVYAWLGEPDDVPSTPLEAFEDTDGDGVIDQDDTPAPNSTWDDTLMRDHTSDLVPDSDPADRVPRNGSRSFVTCYFPTSGAEADPTFDITVRSGFDANVNVGLTHTLNTTATILNLYLRDPQSLETTGPCTDSTWARSQETFSLVDDGVPSCTTLRNFDTNHDLLPGLLLPRGNNPPSAKFDYQFTQSNDTTIGVNGTLRLWTSHPDAITSPSSTSARTIVFDVALKRVNTAAGQNARNTTFYTTRVSYTHPAGVRWEPQSIDLPSIPDTVFRSQEYLRLEISCPNDSDRDCALAYDTSSSPDAGHPAADANLVVASP